jgi:hypothetical protein
LLHLKKQSTFLFQCQVFPSWQHSVKKHLLKETLLDFFYHFFLLHQESGFCSSTPLRRALQRQKEGVVQQRVKVSERRSKFLELLHSRVITVNKIFVYF